MSGAVKFFMAILAGIILVAAVVLGGWSAGWWFKEQNVGNQRDVNRNSQQYQDGLVSQQRSLVQGYDVAVDESQKKQISLRFCASYLNLVEPPNDLVQAEARICN